MKTQGLALGISALLLTTSSLSFAAAPQFELGTALKTSDAQIQSTTLRSRSISSPVTGTFTGGGSFRGTLSITQFSTNRYDQVVVSGTLTGTASGFLGGSTTRVNQSFSKVVAEIEAIDGECSEVSLTVAPIDLDDVGFAVELSSVDIDSQSAPGSSGAIGQLLCSVTDKVGLGDILGLGGLLGKINDLLGNGGGILGSIGGVAGGSGGLLGGLLGGD